MANLEPVPNEMVTNQRVKLWYQSLLVRVGGVGQILWAQVNKDASALSDIASRPHSDLSSILGADATSADTTKNKHVSNANLKAATDHIAATSAHGVNGDFIGSADLATTTDYGVVKKSSAVTDAAASSVSVASANGTATTGTATLAGYGFVSAAELNQFITDVNTHATLANEIKGDVNTLVTDVNAIKTVLNNLLAANRTSGQLST